MEQSPEIIAKRQRNWEVMEEEIARFDVRVSPHHPGLGVLAAQQDFLIAAGHDIGIPCWEKVR